MIYEYKNLLMPLETLKSSDEAGKKRDKIMNDMAQQGWEYMCSETNFFVFRRKRES